MEVLTYFISNDQLFSLVLTKSESLIYLLLAQQLVRAHYYMLSRADGTSLQFSLC